MRDGQRLFANLAAIFTETVLLAAVYTLFGTLQAEGGLTIAVLPWLMWGLGSFLLLRWFTGRERGFSQVIALGLGCYIAGAPILLFYCARLRGTMSWMIALLFLGTTALRCVTLNTQPVPEKRYMNYVELAALSTATLLLMQAGDVQLPMLNNGCLYAAVLLNFVVAIRARIVGDRDTTVTLSRVQGVLALAAVVVLLVMMLGAFMAFGSLPLRDGLLRVLGAAGRAVGYCFDQVSRFLMWLATLLPDAEGGGYEMAPVKLPELAEQREGLLASLPPWAFAAMLLAGALAAAVAAVYLMRGVKLQGRTAGGRRKKAVVSRRPRLGAALARWLGAVAARIRFRWKSWRYRNTPQGTLVCLERWGRLRKLKRLPGETHKAYLRRVCESPRFAGADARALLEALSDALDACYYCPGGRAGAREQFGREQAARVRCLCAGKLEGD